MGWLSACKTKTAGGVAIKNWIDGLFIDYQAPLTFDFSQFIVFFFSLRYEASTNELINEELGIAYPIIDGIPNMIPQAARIIRQNKKQEEAEQH